MAGGAQGSGGTPAVGSQGQQYQNALQGYRQASAGMPSQYPGANMAAPGGGMAASAVMPAPQGQGQMFNPGMGPQISQVMPQAPAPQQPPQMPPGPVMSIMPQVLPGGGQQGQVQNFNPGGPPQISQVMPQAPQVSDVYPQPQQTPQNLSSEQMRIATMMQTANPMYQQAIQQALAQQGQAIPQLPQGQSLEQARAAAMMQTANPMYQQAIQQARANDARFQQNPGMTPRMMGANAPMGGRPQIEGNPNSMPVQRGMGGRG